jgi:glycosidase
VQEANNRGIKVILDMVMNHCGSEHWFVKDPPSLDWINNRGEYVNTSHRRHTNQDLYASQYDRKKFSNGWFVESMPDLNQNNELLADYLIQNSIWWIEYSGASGIRMDTHPYPDKYFMSNWSKRMLREFPFLSMVGEEWSPQPAIVAYWQKDKVNHDGFVSDMTSMMDFPLQVAIKEGMTRTEKSWESGMVPMYEILALDFLYPNPSQLMIFADNHDMDRVFTQLDEDIALTKIAIGFILTIRGIPQIYYGTEILMSNSEAPNDHGIIRTDFPGGWETDSINAFTGINLAADQLEFQNWLKKLLNWRKGNAVIHQGKLLQFAPDKGIYTYFRYNNQKVVMVTINKNFVESKLPLENYREILDPEGRAKEVSSGKTYSLEFDIKVPARSISIFEIESP